MRVLRQPEIPDCFLLISEHRINGLFLRCQEKFYKRIIVFVEDHQPWKMYINRIDALNCERKEIRDQCFSCFCGAGLLCAFNCVITVLSVKKKYDTRHYRSLTSGTLCRLCGKSLLFYTFFVFFTGPSLPLFLSLCPFFFSPSFCLLSVSMLTLQPCQWASWLHGNQ